MIAVTSRDAICRGGRLLAEDGPDPPQPAVPGALLGLRRRVRVRRLAELRHVVPFLSGTLHQLVVHGLIHVRLPAQDLHPPIHTMTQNRSAAETENWDGKQLAKWARTTDPEVLERGLADERVLVPVVDVEHPVVAGDGEDGEEGRHEEADLELGLVAGRVGAPRRALDVAAPAVGPRLVQHLHGGAVRVQRVGRARVGARLWLERGREARDLVPPAHVPLQVQVPHHLHGRRRREARWRAWVLGVGEEVD
jgi:hypothetical protein